MSDVYKLYQDFHQADPQTKRRVKVPTPKQGELMKLGRLVEIVYEPEGQSRLASKQFFHEFTDKGSGVRKNAPLPILASDGKDLYIIRDESDYYMSDRGIIG